MSRRTEIEQARANALKVVRTAVRLRHSIEADNELNEKIDEAGKVFDAAVARKELPDPLTILAAIGETAVDA
jgi:hypothetical protein